MPKVPYDPNRVTRPSAAELDRLAGMAATIAAGIEANPTNEVHTRDGGRDFMDTGLVASRAVEIARAILAEVREP